MEIHYVISISMVSGQYIEAPWYIHAYIADCHHRFRQRLVTCSATNTLLKPLLTYYGCQSFTWNQTYVAFESKCENFYSTKSLSEKCWPFCPVSQWIKSTEVNVFPPFEPEFLFFFFHRLFSMNYVDTGCWVGYGRYIISRNALDRRLATVFRVLFRLVPQDCDLRMRRTRGSCDGSRGLPAGQQRVTRDDLTTMSREILVPKISLHKKNVALCPGEYRYANKRYSFIYLCTETELPEFSAPEVVKMKFPVQAAVEKLVKITFLSQCLLKPWPPTKSRKYFPWQKHTNFYCASSHMALRCRIDDCNFGFRYWHGAW